MNHFLVKIVFFMLLVLQLVGLLTHNNVVISLTDGIVGLFLLYCYFMAVKTSYSLLFVSSFILLLISDLVYIFSPSHNSMHEIVLIINIILIIVFIFFGLKGILSSKKYKLDVPLKIALFLASLFFIHIFFEVELLVKHNYPKKLYLFFVIYGFLLCAATLITIINFLFKPNRTNINLTFTVVCFLISDMFFVLYQYYVQIPIFKIIVYLSHFLVYYLFFSFQISKQMEINYKVDDKNH